MSEDNCVAVNQSPTGIVLSFDETLYPKDAVFTAAYSLLDRCFVHIGREGSKLLVRLRAKPGMTVAPEVLSGDFQSEALAQTWRRQIVQENQALIEALTSRALQGAAGPPGLDDMLDENLGDLGDAFDDPLGIAVSWEEKYGKGKDRADAKAQDAPEQEAPPQVESAKAEPEVEPKAEPKPDSEPELKAESKAESKADAESKVEAAADAKPEPQAVEQSEQAAPQDGHEKAEDAP